MSFFTLKWLGVYWTVNNNDGLTFALIHAARSLQTIKTRKTWRILLLSNNLVYTEELVNNNGGLTFASIPSARSLQTIHLGT